MCEGEKNNDYFSSPSFPQLALRRTKIYIDLLLVRGLVRGLVRLRLRLLQGIRVH
jgi:hypothetical protein